VNNNTHLMQPIRPNFWGGATISVNALKDVGTLFHMLAVYPHTTDFDAVALIGKVTDAVTLLCEQENAHVALTSDIAAVSGTTHPVVFAQQYMFKFRGTGILATIHVDTSLDTPTLAYDVESTGGDETISRYLVGAFHKQLARLIG